MPEPDYRAMWEELKRSVRSMCDDAGTLTFEEDTENDGRLHGLHDVEDHMEGIEKRAALNPDYTPAVRRVVALSDDALDAIERDDETDDLQKWRTFVFALGIQRRRCSDLREDLNRALCHRDEKAGHR